MKLCFMQNIIDKTEEPIDVFFSMPIIKKELSKNFLPQYFFYVMASGGLYSHICIKLTKMCFS